MSFLNIFFKYVIECVLVIEHWCFLPRSSQFIYYTYASCALRFQWPNTSSTWELTLKRLLGILFINFQLNLIDLLKWFYLWIHLNFLKKAVKFVLKTLSKYIYFIDFKYFMFPRGIRCEYISWSKITLKICLTNNVYW